MSAQGAGAIAVPLKTWAAERDLPLSTAQRYAREGRLNGTGRDHPHAYQDGQGRWWVCPQVYTRVEVVDAPSVDVNARLADALERVAAELRRS